jgi:hypothetical protein
MPINVRNLSIQQVIAHQVPKRDRSIDADAAITFSDAPIPGLQATKQNFFVERINASLLERAYSIVPLAGHVSTMPALVHGLIHDPSLLVSNSKDMARALYNAQRQVSNPGLVTVILGRLLDEPCVAVLKLEYREGMQIQPITTEAGEQTFSANILDDLTLTEDGRVFKASVFRSRTDEPAGLEGLASDDQRRPGSGQALADFFLNTFLGCTFATAPDRQTQEFYDAAVSFFDRLPDPEHRIEYRRALVATLLSPTPSISAPQFSEQFLRDEHKATFDAVFEERKVSMTAFDKDTRLIDSQIKRTRVRTVHGLSLSGPPEVMAERVSIEPGSGDEPARIVIADNVTKVGS